MRLFFISTALRTSTIEEFGVYSRLVSLLIMNMISPKMNVWCDLIHVRTIGHFIVVERTVNDEVYCDILKEYHFPHLEDIVAGNGLVHFQRDGAPPHFTLHVG